jgi:molybdate transport system substrate-binding protein
MSNELFSGARGGCRTRKQAGNSAGKGATLRFSRIGGRVASLLALVALCACLGAGGASAKSGRATAGITVFAGSSMTTVLPEIDPNNTYSLGSTTAFATQIVNGAPADLLLGANTASCSALYAQGVADKPVLFTRNTLEVIVPKANPANIKSIYDLTKPGIKVVEAAASVPVGTYTLQVLNQMGLNAAVQANVVSQETTVANVVQKVALGQADAGFAYLSDYVVDPKHLTLIKVPAWAQPKIQYSGCIVSKSPNKAAAQAFLDRILSPAGQAIFVKDGFLPLTAPVPTIAKIAPAKATVGATVTLTGTNFTGTTSVTIQGVAAKFKVASATKLTLTIPAKAKSGTITVTNPSGTATSKAYTIN